MTGTVLAMASLDTKADEAGYLIERLRGLGLQVRVMDVGVLGEPGLTADIGREEVAAAGGSSIPDLVKLHDHAAAADVMGTGCARLVKELLAEGAIDGVIGMGGGTGSMVTSTALRTVPPGFPSLLITTTVRRADRFFGSSDLMVIHSIVDIAGLNSILMRVLDKAAAAIYGMIEGRRANPRGTGPVIGATMYGVTTPGMTAARARLEEFGYEVLVFHANGAGGDAMEGLIASGEIEGVFEFTTTELADDVVGGLAASGPGRFSEAARRGIPAVYSLGGLDLVNFGSPGTLPERYAGRVTTQHSSTSTLLRTSEEECRIIAQRLAEVLNRHPHGVALFIPLKGVSSLDVEGGPFEDVRADQALFSELRTRLRPEVEVHALDLHINDPRFALAMADRFNELFQQSSPHKGDLP